MAYKIVYIRLKENQVCFFFCLMLGIVYAIEHTQYFAIKRAKDWGINFDFLSTFVKIAKCLRR